MIGSMLRAGVQGAVTQEPTKDEQNQDAACTVPVERLPNCFLMHRERERDQNFITSGTMILRSCLLFQSNVLSNLHARRERERERERERQRQRQRERERELELETRIVVLRYGSELYYTRE